MKTLLRLLWLIAWFVCQRLMMACGLLETNSVLGTVLVTIGMFLFCYFSVDTWLLLFYLPTVLVSGILLFMGGAWLPAIMLWVFHFGLYVIFVKTKKPVEES